jgi:PAS domain S-box-containing protein
VVDDKKSKTGQKQEIESLRREIARLEKELEAAKSSWTTEERQKNYRQIFDASNDSIYIHYLEPDGAPGKFIEANPVALKRLGMSREELLQCTPMDIAQLKTPGDFKRLSQRLIKEKHLLVESKGLPKTGGKIPIEVHLHLIEVDGKPAVLAISRDLSERKAVEETLRETSETYQALVRALPHAVTVTDLEGTVIDTSLQALKLLGYQDAQEVIGKKLGEFVAPEEIPRGARDLAAILEKGTVRRNRFVHKRKDGSTFIGEISASVVNDADGKPKMLIGITEDVTERELAQKALEASEQKFRLIAENSTDVVFVADPQMRILYISPAVLRVSGFSVEETLKMSLEETMPPDAYQKAVAFLNNLIETQSKNGVDPQAVATIELELFHKDGPPYFSEIRVKTIPDQAGKPALMIGALRDITDRRKAEQALRESEARYRMLFDSISDAVFVVGITRDGGVGNFLEANETAFKRLGYSREELLNLHPQDLLDAGFRKNLDKLKKDLLEKKLILFEGETVSRQGKRYPVEISVHLFELAGQPAVLAISRDISERKRIEQALIESESSYRLLAENATDVIFTMDLELRLTYVSPSIKRSSGYAVEEVIKLELKDLITEDSLWKAVRALSDELTNERTGGHPPDRSVVLEIDMVRKDGGIDHTEILASFMRDENGLAAGIMGVMRIINTRKLAEEALKESEQQ